MVLAAAGDTWGISGPTFLVISVVIAVVVWVVTTRVRRARAGPRLPAGTRGSGQSQPRRRNHQNGRMAEMTISPSAIG